VHTARSRLCLRYEVDFNDLAVVSVDNDFENSRATVTLRGPGGTQYVVEVYRHNGRVTVVRIFHGPDNA
jgi:hypothetical protein